MFKENDKWLSRYLLCAKIKLIVEICASLILFIIGVAVEGLFPVVEEAVLPLCLLVFGLLICFFITSYVKTMANIAKKCDIKFIRNKMYDVSDEELLKLLKKKK